jgi:hypothetical protein
MDGFAILAGAIGLLIGGIIWAIQGEAHESWAELFDPHPGPEPDLLDRSWAEFERFAATGDEDYLQAAADLRFESEFDLELEEMDARRRLS